MLCWDTFFFFFFCQLTESNKLWIIFPLYVKVGENCEMFKNKLLTSIGEKWNVAPSPSKTYFCVWTPSFLSLWLSRGHSCMLGIWKESNFQSTHAVLHFRDDSMIVPLKADAAFLPFQMIFIITAFCSTYYRWITWDNFLQREFFIH